VKLSEGCLLESLACQHSTLGKLPAPAPNLAAEKYVASVTDQYDADGQFAGFRVGLSVIGYNTSLVKPADAPKSFADLLEPKWAGKIVKAHPGYSGTIMTATHQLTRDLGWEYLEKLAKQRIMQVQSASDPPKKLEIGERAVQADGNEYNLLQIKEKKGPVDIVYATEGTPLIVGPNGIFKNAPNPNAARLFQAYCFTAECQQLIVDVGKVVSNDRFAADRFEHFDELRARVGVRCPRAVEDWQFGRRRSVAAK